MNKNRGLWKTLKFKLGSRDYSEDATSVKVIKEYRLIVFGIVYVSIDKIIDRLKGFNANLDDLILCKVLSISEF